MCVLRDINKSNPDVTHAWRERSEIQCLLS